MAWFLIAALGNALALASVPPPCPPDPPTVMLPPELARVLSDYERAWRAKDPLALAELFVEDGFVMSPGAPPARGRAAIRERYAGSGAPLALRAFAWAAEGSAGYIIGGFARSNRERDRGKFTLTLRRGEDGRWKIVSDMDNGNGPPVPPATTPSG